MLTLDTYILFFSFLQPSQLMNLHLGLRQFLASLFLTKGPARWGVLLCTFCFEVTTLLSRWEKKEKRMLLSCASTFVVLWIQLNVLVCSFFSCVMHKGSLSQMTLGRSLITLWMSLAKFSFLFLSEPFTVYKMTIRWLMFWKL